MAKKKKTSIPLKDLKILLFLAVMIGGLATAFLLKRGQGFDLRNQAYNPDNRCPYAPVDVQIRKSGLNSPWQTANEVNLKKGDRIDVNCFAAQGKSLLPEGQLKVWYFNPNQDYPSDDLFEEVKTGTQLRDQTTRGNQLRGLQIEKDGRYWIQCSHPSNPYCIDSERFAVGVNPSQQTDSSVTSNQPARQPAAVCDANSSFEVRYLDVTRGTNPTIDGGVAPRDQFLAFDQWLTAEQMSRRLEPGDRVIAACADFSSSERFTATLNGEVGTQLYLKLWQYGAALAPTWMDYPAHPTDRNSLWLTGVGLEYPLRLVTVQEPGTYQITCRYRVASDGGTGLCWNPSFLNVTQANFQ